MTRPERQATSAEYRKAMMKEPKLYWKASAILGAAVAFSIIVILNVVGFAFYRLIERIPDELFWLVYLAPIAVTTLVLGGFHNPVCQHIADRERERRLDRGECIWCRYPRPGSVHDVCTECGKTSVIR